MSKDQRVAFEVYERAGINDASAEKSRVAMIAPGKFSRHDNTSASNFCRDELQKGKSSVHTRRI